MKKGPLILGKTLSKRQRAMNKRAIVWQAMRIQRQFSIGDLLAVCELGAEKRRSVTTYCGLLRSAGYLVKTRINNGHRQALYCLVRNSGPRAPAYITSERLFFDPNTETTYPLSRKSDVCSRN